MNTTISVITRTSRIQFLNETIESVVNLINTPHQITWEYIIVNDGNPDVSKYLNAQSFPENFSFIDLKENVGRKKAFNLGVAKAKYDWIFVLDDDDIILQRTLANFAVAIKSNPKTNWFVADFLRVDAKLSYLSGEDYYGWKFKDVSDLLKSVLTGDHFIQFNTLIKKELIARVGGMDENFVGPEDIDMYLSFLEQEEMPIYLHFYSHLHRMHETNRSQKMTKSLYLNTHLIALKEKYKHLLAK
jgi:GT2 family glycosyltransferase